VPPRPPAPGQEIDGPTGPNSRALGKGARAVMLGTEFRRIAELAGAMGWRGTLVVRDGQLLVEQNGALFHAQDEFRFFRDDGRSIARPMQRKLKERGLPIRTVFDLGANIGEVAISFARAHPDARVYAFEPAPENLLRLDANIALQPKTCRNLTVVREAVSDRRGEIEITVGAGGLNTVMTRGNRERVAARADIHVQRVPTDTLDSYCARFGVERIDFLKVDIEGAEPLLSASVRRLAGRIGSAYVEISRFNALDAYLELADAFAAGGLVMENRRVPIPDPRPYLEQSLERSPATNVWFMPGR